MRSQGGEEVLLALAMEAKKMEEQGVPGRDVGSRESYCVLGYLRTFPGYFFLPLWRMASVNMGGYVNIGERVDIVS